MDVALDEHETAVAERVANEIYKYDVSHGFICQLKDKSKDPRVATVEGKLGEMAFCKIFNIFPDLIVRHKIEPIDAILPDGRTVDVKTTSLTNGNLIVKKETIKYREAIGYFALMCGAGARYTYVGMMRSVDVFRDENIRDLGNGPHYFIHRDRLDYVLWFGM